MGSEILPERQPPGTVSYSNMPRSLLASAARTSGLSHGTPLVDEEEGGTGTDEWFLEFLLFIAPVVLWVVVIIYRARTKVDPDDSQFSNDAFSMDKLRSHGECKAMPSSSYFGLQHIGPFVAQTWLFQPAVVLTRATACSWLAVLFVEIALLGIVLSNVTGHSVSKTVLMWPLLYVPIEIFSRSAFKPVTIKDGEHIDTWGYIGTSLCAVITTFAGWCFITRATNFRTSDTWYWIGCAMYSAVFVGFTLFTVLFTQKMDVFKFDKTEQKLHFNGDLYALVTRSDLVVWALTMTAFVVWQTSTLVSVTAYKNAGWPIFIFLFPIAVHFLQNLFHVIHLKSVKRGLWNIVICLLFIGTITCLHYRMCDVDGIECAKATSAFWTSDSMFIIVTLALLSWSTLFVGVIDSTYAPQMHFNLDCLAKKTDADITADGKPNPGIMANHYYTMKN